jgi:hypothetical protein
MLVMFHNNVIYCYIPWGGGETYLGHRIPPEAKGFYGVDVFIESSNRNLLPVNILGF